MSNISSRFDTPVCTTNSVNILCIKCPSQWTSVDAVTVRNLGRTDLHNQNGCYYIKHIIYYTESFWVLCFWNENVVHGDTRRLGGYADKLELSDYFSSLTKQEDTSLKHDGLYTCVQQSKLYGQPSNERSTEIQWDGQSRCTFLGLRTAPCRWSWLILLYHLERL